MAKKQNKPIKTCAEYITKDQVIEWFRPYGHTGEDIPFYVLDDDIFEMKAADVAPVVHSHWICEKAADGFDLWKCSHCGAGTNQDPKDILLYCFHCGAKMGKEVNE